MRRLFVIICTNIYAFKDIIPCVETPWVWQLLHQQLRIRLYVHNDPPSVCLPHLRQREPQIWHIHTHILDIWHNLRIKVQLNVLPKEKRLTLTTFSRIRFVNSARCGYFDCGLYCCCRFSYRNRSRTTNNLLKSTPTTKSRINSMLTVICDDLRTVSHHFARSWGVVVFQNTSITLMNEWQRTGKIYINNVSYGFI